MGFLLVMKAEIVRSFIIMRRYWFASLIGMVMGYGFLMGLVYAFFANRPQAEQWASSAFQGVVGFIIGLFAFGIVGLFTQGLQGLARSGQLEQLCMSPHGLAVNFLARSMVSAVSSIFSLSIMLALVAMTLGEGFHADPVPLIVLLVLTYFDLIGFGFMIGGLVLVFKQTGQVAVLVRMALFGLAVSATERVAEWPVLLRVIAHALPVTDAAICLKLVLVDGRGSAVFQVPEFRLLVVNCVFWTTVGLGCFRFLENWSRDRGTLGAY